MNKLIEKIVERINDRIKHYDDREKILTDARMLNDSTKLATRISELCFVRDVIQEETKAYENCTLCYLGSPCEYQNENAKMSKGHWNNGWIPCSERLPEKCGDYLICDDVGKVYESTYFIDEYGNRWLTKFFDNTVIAWQPLPQPYKESENE